MNELYCIEHEGMSHAEEGLVFGHLTYIPVFDETGTPMGVDADLCEFPSGWATCPPPELEKDWIDHAVEFGEESVSEDELKPVYYYDPELPEEAVYLLS